MATVEIAPEPTQFFDQREPSVSRAHSKIKKSQRRVFDVVENSNEQEYEQERSAELPELVDELISFPPVSSLPVAPDFSREETSSPTDTVDDKPGKLHWSEQTEPEQTEVIELLPQLNTRSQTQPTSSSQGTALETTQGSASEHEPDSSSLNDIESIRFSSITDGHRGDEESNDYTTRDLTDPLKPRDVRTSAMAVRARNALRESEAFRAWRLSIEEEQLVLALRTQSSDPNVPAVTKRTQSRPKDKSAKPSTTHTNTDTNSNQPNIKQMKLKTFLKEIHEKEITLHEKEITHHPNKTP